MQSFILARLYKKPSGFTGDCKKKNEEKKKCFKTINSSRLFPVHRIRWLFFGSQFISHSIYHRCWTMFNTLRKVIHSFTLRFHSKLWSMEHRTWLCVCVFRAKIPNLSDQTIHQSWRVAFMPKKKCLTFVMKTFERISLNHKNECEIGDARSKYVCLNKWLKVNATFFCETMYFFENS